MFNNLWQRKLSPLLQAEPKIQSSMSEKFIVEVSGLYSDRVSNLVLANQGRIHRELNRLSALVIDYPKAGLEELARFNFVHKIWHDAPAYALLNVAVPTVGASQGHEFGYTGKNVVVAVIDTGIAPHPDLVGGENRILAWTDLVNDRNEPYDDNGHGTHVAGIIGGNGHSSNGRYLGMAPDARLVGIKVLDKDGSGSLSNVIEAIEWCLNNQKQLNVRIINLSLGTAAQESYRTDPLCRIAAEAWRNGIFICCAAGNQGPDPHSINSPGISPVVITVGNIDDRNTIDPSDDRLNRTSSKGPTIDDLAKPDLVAPGTEITSLSNRGGYRTMTGTSMSTPMVAGAAAQILQQYPQLTPDQIKNLLMKNARTKGLGPNLQGAGELNLSNLFEKNERKATITASSGYLSKIVFYQLIKFFFSKAIPGFTEIPKWLDHRSENFVINLLETLNL